MKRRPDFIIIGSMKSATSTLHEQLAYQPGIFMTTPKEPCFFSDDHVYARGEGWYATLFQTAADDCLCGESSTHYTKLPTYPRTIKRMKKHLPRVKLVYIMRHPIDRLVSQYIHEWTMREHDCKSIDRAIDELPRLVDYSRYTYQLRPYLDAYGPGNVLPVFSERLTADPQAELQRVCRFIGYRGKARWRDDIDAQNVSEQRIRESGLRDAVVYAPGVSQVRSKLIPQSWRDRVKRLWQMRRRPDISPDRLERLRWVFDDDLAVLSRWLGIQINCENFDDVAAKKSYDWTNAVNDRTAREPLADDKLGVVVIGRNEGERLKRCLDSVAGRAQHVVYVDSGSTDGSIEAARALGVDVVELDTNVPFTMARGRNAGLRHLLTHEPDLVWVQFVDGDCEVVDGWLGHGRAALAALPGAAVVSGRRRERQREASWYNRLADMEWDTPVGEAKYCHGDAMMRVAALREVGGFNEAMICGEEPELCVRLRQRGWKIERLDAEMTLHDAAMTRFGQWWRRSVRNGWGYAEGAAMHGRPPQRHWVHESRNIWFYGLILPVVSIAPAWWTWGLSLLLLLWYPRHAWKVFKDRRAHSDTRRDARLYALFCTIGKLPNMIGQIKYHLHRLRGGQARLIEYKHTESREPSAAFEPVGSQTSSVGSQS